jgi:hypothetical protein
MAPRARRCSGGGLAALAGWPGRDGLFRTGGATAPPPAGELGGQRVERLGERRERVREPGQPCPGGVEPGLVECVDAARAGGAHAHETGRAQDLEVLGDGGL